MWQYKILAVSWLCVFWTRAEDSSTPVHGESPVLPTKGDFPGEMVDFTYGNVETTRRYASDSTVRSFFPMRGKQKWIKRSYPPAEEMLFFNVSAVNENEEVTLAELHLHRRRIAKIHGSYHKRFLPLPYRVVLYQVQPDYRHKVDRDARTMKLASLPVSYATKSGWYTLDVTAVLRELLINAQGPPELLLGVEFEAPKGIAKAYPPLVPLKHFLKLSDASPHDHPFKSSSYLVVFSEVDPYFEDFEEGNGNYPSYESENDVPGGHSFKERHLKHKMFKVKSNDEPDDITSNVIDMKGTTTTTTTNWKEKMEKKHKGTENEIRGTDYGQGKEDVVRHGNKYKMNDVRRSKADELALQQKNKLKSLPFLHTNEVEEIRQTSRRLARSLHPGNATLSHGKGWKVARNLPRTKDMRRILNNLIKERVDMQMRNESGKVLCKKSTVTIALRDVDLGVEIISPDSFVAIHCGGLCHPKQQAYTDTCGPSSRRPMNLAYSDANGKRNVLQLKNFLVTDCKCRRSAVRSRRK